MTLAKWLFAFSGRISRRAFWLWIALYCGMITLLCALADNDTLSLQHAALFIMILLWPTAAVMSKRLHDRNHSGGWSLLLVIAWLLAMGQWPWLPEWAAWLLKNPIPVALIMTVFVELGFMRGSSGHNRFGTMTQGLYWRRTYQ